MASKAHNTNIVRLPTAARRQVQQPCNAAGRAARQALRQSCPWPGEYKHPGEREREAVEAAKPSLAHIEHTPSLVMAMAIFGMADEGCRRAALNCAKLIACVRPGAAADDAVLMMEAVANLTEDAKKVARLSSC